MRSVRRRLAALAVTTGAVSLAAPVAGAGAQVPWFGPSAGGTAIGGNQIGSAGCV